ncbi:MAG: putative RNA-binding protein (virulence factor B family) [Psychromonas sp.]|jgi:predicted RNA-binding protein (virulence factor B family)
MLNVGQQNILKVLRGTSVGFYLADDENNDVLLPHKYIPEGLSVGDDIDVFLYRDSEDRIIATTIEPLIKLNQFACLQVSAATGIGAFLNWGLEKDLFVPFREQNQKLREGDYTVIYLYLDKDTDRLVGSCRLNRHFEFEDIELKEGEQVDLLILDKTDLGFNVAVNHKYRGLIYENEIFQRIAWGDSTKGFVKAVREDGKIDISLQKQGYENINEPNARKVLETLQANGGELVLSDKSDSSEIQGTLEMSKKAFKRAIGSLYKQKLITIELEGIKLV